MKIYLFKTLLLLCALMAGSGSVWADATTYSFSSIPTTGWSKNGGKQTINNKSWTYSSCTYIGTNSGRIQIGSKNDPQTSAWTIQIPISSFGENKAISAVSITAYTTENSATYDISVGGTSAKSGSLSTSSATYEAKGLYATSGDIVVTLTGSSTSKAMYLSNISVTYDDAATDPIIGASDVEISASATSGEFNYTISNPVVGASLEASVTTGNAWLSDPIVANGKVTFTTTVNTDEVNDRVGTIHLVYGENLATKDVTVTQAAMPKKYTVTYESDQTGGTLTIKNGEAVVASGSKLPAGTNLTIVATPNNETYKYRNWQYKVGDGSWITCTTTMTYEMPADDVEFRANFDVTYPVNFYVNGQLSSTVRYAKDEDIAFGTPKAFGGYNFIGWAETAIDGKSSDAPTVVTTTVKMGTSEKDYYAVYAKIKEDEVTATFDASDISNLTENTSLKWTHNATGITLSLSNGQHYTSGTPNTFTVTSGTSNYFKVEVPTGGRLTKIVTTISGNNYKINSVTAGTLSTSNTTQTITFTGNVSTVNCKATNNYQIRAKTIAVDAILSTILGYYTNLIESVIITSAKYATYCRPNAVDFSGTGIKAYTATDGETSVTLNEITSGQVPASSPVVLYKENADGSAINVPVIASAEAPEGTNDLHVVGEGGLTGEDYIYVLAKPEDKVGFFLWDKTKTLEAGKVYLQGKANYGARLFLGFDETQGIDAAQMNNETTDNVVFDLQGRRVVKPAKGLYIMNGRKVMVK